MSTRFAAAAIVLLVGAPAAAQEVGLFVNRPQYLLCSERPCFRFEVVAKNPLTGAIVDLPADTEFKVFRDDRLLPNVSRFAARTTGSGRASPTRST